MKSMLIILAGLTLLFTLAFPSDVTTPTTLPEYRETWEESEVEIVALKKARKRPLFRGM